MNNTLLSNMSNEIAVEWEKSANQLSPEALERTSNRVRDLQHSLHIGQRHLGKIAPTSPHNRFLISAAIGDLKDTNALLKMHQQSLQDHYFPVRQGLQGFINKLKGR